jgi:hypothetical protein
MLSNGAGEGVRRDVEFNSLNLLISHLYVDFKKCSILLLFRKNIAISERNQMFSKNKKTLAGKEGGDPKKLLTLKQEKIYSHIIDLKGIKKEKDDIHSFIF